MTTTTQQRTTPRWALSFLAAIVAVLAVVFAAATASAATAAGSETRVRASGFVVEVPVGPPEHISAGQRLGEAADRVVTVVATGVAAETADAATTTGLRDAAESCLNSFTADTPVTMADGTKKPISTVKVGDKVLATDPATGKTKPSPSCN